VKSDPNLYDFAPYHNRPPIVWPDGKQVAVWIAPNLEFYELDPPPHPMRKSWTKPHPDVVGYSHRDHSNRVSHWRMADAMTEHGFPGSVSLSVALCQHHPEVVADANARGWEFFSHGIYNTRYAYGMSEDHERAIIEDSIRTVRDATGQTIRGWLAPALTHTENTLDLIAEYGLDYTCDLYHDDQPQRVKTKSGDLISMPYSLEVNDHYGFFVYNMSPRDYADTLVRQFRRLADEGGTVMCIPLHAYLIGQPHRIGPFTEALREIAADGRGWLTTAGDIADAWRGQGPPTPPQDRAPGTKAVSRGSELHPVGSNTAPFPDPVPASKEPETIDPAYLTYPLRHLGYDHDLYPWSALKDRPPITWPGGAAVAVPIIVSLEYFPLMPSDTPFRAPGHMQTPYPDYRHYTAREYGTRIGFYRLLDAFAKAGIRASVATNSVIAERYPQIIADIVAAGHEIIAHSTDMNGTIATGLAETDERSLIQTALDTLERVSGTRPTGWLSIARSQSWNTHRLLKEAGVTYACDWVNDELPYEFTNSLINIPLNHELSDRQIVTVQQHSADSYAQQIHDAFDRLAGEIGGRMLPLHITPYIMGLPYRIDAFEQLLAALVAKGAWFATATAIVTAWKAQQ
jgi:allantoinase